MSGANKINLRFSAVADVSNALRLSSNVSVSASVTGSMPRLAISGIFSGNIDTTVAMKSVRRTDCSVDSKILVIVRDK